MRLGRSQSHRLVLRCTELRFSLWCSGRDWSLMYISARNESDPLLKPESQGMAPHTYYCLVFVLISPPPAPIPPAPVISSPTFVHQKKTWFRHDSCISVLDFSRWLRGRRIVWQTWVTLCRRLPANFSIGVPVWTSGNGHRYHRSRYCCYQHCRHRQYLLTEVAKIKYSRIDNNKYCIIRNCESWRSRSKKWMLKKKKEKGGGWGERGWWREVGEVDDRDDEWERRNKQRVALLSKHRFPFSVSQQIGPRVPCQQQRSRNDKAKDLVKLLAVWTPAITAIRNWSHLGG